MKQLVAFVLAGGLMFGIAASLSVGLYWLAPIVPCYVTESSPYGGYGGQREDLCTGEQLHSYSYAWGQYRERHEARRVHVVLALGTLGASALAGLLAVSLVQRIERRRKAPAAPSDVRRAA
ncbi:hypothetical protein [Sandaracinus amylolyticus]|uniref:Transmembrane protein n=1 Tax=Sandaracinus amylolyticus TaxID=927083 RepID=A0A0F6WAF0_9BACT|nr:hypothetical protein [Sandaracinus amylolyticus]AKF11517.1 hypothetical protein DB32_008666 [Sandaracinus amylolyticus]